MKRVGRETAEPVLKKYGTVMSEEVWPRLPEAATGFRSNSLNADVVPQMALLHTMFTLESQRREGAMEKNCIKLNVSHTRKSSPLRSFYRPPPLPSLPSCQCMSRDVGCPRRARSPNSRQQQRSASSDLSACSAAQQLFADTLQLFLLAFFLISQSTTSF